MKNIKVFALALVTGLLFAGAFAFTTHTNTTPENKAAFSAYFELVANGDPLERTDWILSTSNPDCPTTHSSMPCRIDAVADGNNNPDATSFSTILSGSNNFQQAYTQKVTYKP